MKMMIKTAVAVGLCLSATASANVTFDWVQIGDPTKPADSTGLGQVAYTYYISKYETTNAQYVGFLNSVDPNGENTLGLYDSYMTSDPAGVAYSGGINFDEGGAPGAKYSAKSGHENKPVVHVSPVSALRMMNWLHNGQPTLGGTESGAYDLSVFDEQPPGYPVRSANAQYFLPNLNEWYKAAFGKPGSTGGDAGYWNYPTGSDVEPVSAPPGAGANRANFYSDDDDYGNGINDGYAVTGALSINPSLTYITDVGAYVDSPSGYGTFDQAGNVHEWLEDLYYPQHDPGASPFNLIIGGSWQENSFNFLAGNEGTPQTFGTVSIGFRVVSVVPEPASLGLISATGLLLKRRPRAAVFRTSTS